MVSCKSPRSPKSRRISACFATLALVVAAWSSTLSVAGADVSPVIAAAGDIACDPANPAFNGGAGTESACRQMATGNQLEGRGFAAVLPLGDIQYECGGLAAFAQSYDPAWGAPDVTAVTRPVVGNHEYQSSGGTDCGTGASGYFSYFGAAAGTPGEGWYSYDIGAWHVVALNSNCARVSCLAGGPQEQWLAQDLAQHTNACTIAYFHHPAFSAGGGTFNTNTKVLPFWQDLYSAGAEVVLNGHKHNYQRMTQLDPTGAPDPVRGIRQFIVGTGGSDLGLGNTPYPGTEFSDEDHFGVIELTLHPTSYEWRFVSESGVVVDSGSDECVTVAGPTITGFSPGAGTAGDPVTITGTGLSGATSVEFNGATAAFDVIDDSTIDATVPSGATTGPISVTSLSGTATSASDFTVESSTGPTMVQHTLATGGGSTGPSATWSQPTSSGSLLAAVLGWSGSGTPTPPAGWTLARKAGGTAIYFRQGAPSQSTPVTFGGSGLGTWVLDIMEWNGIATTAALDKRASASSGSVTGFTAQSGTTALTSQPIEIAIAAISAQAATTQSNPTAGFSQVAVGTAGVNTTGAYAKVLTATGAQAVSVTLGSAARWRGVIATFRAA